MYSFGFAAVFEFEIEVAKHYNCKVFTFDCTVKYIEPIKLQLPDRVAFYPWCIGSKDELKSTSDGGSETQLQFYTIQTIMKKLGHRQLDVLKLDIERYEFDVIGSFEKNAHLPHQLIVEFHLHNPIPRKEITSPVRYSEWEDIWEHLEYLGYRFFSYDFNPSCNCCCKYSGLRISS